MEGDQETSGDSSSLYLNEAKSPAALETATSIHSRVGSTESGELEDGSNESDGSDNLDSDEIQTCDTCKCEINDDHLCSEAHETQETHSERRRRSRKVPPRPLDEKKAKLRTSKDIYDRLKWDSNSIILGTHTEQETKSIDLTTVYIGYKDRFLGICELPFESFEVGGDIPFHRVYYFRTGGPPVEPFIGKDGEVKVREDNLPKEAVFIWDRDTRTDLVFKSGNSTHLKT